MRGVLAVFSILIILIMVIPGAQALSQPNVTMIPSEFSANASFLVVVDPGYTIDPIRIVWTVPGASATNIGMIPRVGDNYYCYFSNIDNESTCGPTPFTEATLGTPYNMYITTVNHLGQQAQVIENVSTGDIDLSITKTQVNETVVLVVTPVGVDANAIGFSVFDSNFNQIRSFASMDMDPYLHWHGNFTADSYGTYYITIKAQAAGGRFGGNMIKVEIQEPGIYIDPNTTIESSQIVVDPVVMDVGINKGQEMERTGFRITNTGNETLYDMSVSIPTHISGVLSAELSNDTLNGSETIFMTITLNNIQAGGEIFTSLNLTTNNTFIKSIPVNITLTVWDQCNDECICPPPEGDLSISPGSITGEYLIYDLISEEFTITNGGDSNIENITYSGGLSDLVTSLEMVTPLIVPGGSGIINISMMSVTQGTETGSVIIETEVGNIPILMVLNFYDDISNDIDSLETDLGGFKAGLSSDQLNSLIGIISSIESYIQNAEYDIQSGSYSSAELRYEKAEAMFTTLNNTLNAGVTPVSGEEFDITLIIIIAIVVVAGIVVFMVIKKIRGKKKTGSGEEFEDDNDDEFDEDF